MKHYMTATFLVLAGITLTGISGRAAAVSYNDGDVFLGFHASGGTGATQTYLIDIGQASIFRDKADGSSTALSLGSIGTDLAALYGNNWFNRADLSWGVGGAASGAVSGDPGNTLYASREELQVGTLADPWSRRSGSAQGTTVSKIQGLASGYLNTGNSTANSNFAVVQNTSDPNNWASFQPGGANANGNISFGAYNPTVEGGFGGGVAGTALDFFRMTPSSVAGLPGSYEGTFTINENGTILFSVVPEPGVIGLLGIGMGLIGLARRGRRIPF